MQVLVGAARAGRGLAQLAALDQLVEQEPGVGRDGAVTLVLG
jgi:hypothetical protein